MKIVAVIPVLGRLPLLVHTIDRLYRKNGIYKVICVGEHLEERAIVEAMGAEFVRFKNKPLGKKWNAGFVEARQYSPDAALFMGSSDWVSDNWVPVMYEYLKKFSMVGHNGFNLMDVSKDNGVRMHYWKGYNGVRSEEPIGIGRLISGEMLRKLNYRPVLGQLNNSMDSSMCKKIIKAGGNYLEPPSQEAILETYSFFKSRIIDTIEKHRGEFWGWKDPRTTLTIELFHQHLPNPHYVSLFRSPVEVAKSLHRRNSCSIQKGLITAKEYNYRLIKFLAKHHLM